MKTVFDEAFIPYGKVIEGYDIKALLDTLVRVTDMPADHVLYEPAKPELEALPIFDALRDGVYGGMPIQIGYCNGNNKALNCLEYHRDSELNITQTDAVFLLAPLQSVKDGKLDTKEVEAFFAPAGTCLQLYETTLHYAPCTAKGQAGFRVAVVLPKGTNTAKPQAAARNLEDKLLFARNKWLIAHPDASAAKQGAYVGLVGENIVIE